MAKPKSTRIQRACRYCQTIFDVPEYRAKRGQGVTCAECNNATAEQRFWRKVDKADGCWLWRGGTSNRGYGAAFVRGRLVGAHRAAWELTYGPIPDGQWVLHRCDNPPCVNPDHLFLGTHEENMHDMASKGRRIGAGRKLTPERVIEARALLEQGVSQSNVAARFGVSRSAIAQMVRGNSWRSVNGR